MKIKGCAGWVTKFFFFFLRKISCTCYWSLSWDCESLVWGFGAGRGGLFGGEVGGVAYQTHTFWGWIAWSVLRVDAFGWFLSFPGLLSGPNSVPGA